jgi:uncharacterized protein (TIGR02117 family)
VTLGRWLIVGVTAPLAVVMLYLAAGFGLGALATGSPAAQGPVRLAVVSNFYHTDLLLPAEDWRQLLDLPRAARWVAFGWGDRAFYTETPTLGDLKLSTVIAALSGTDAAVIHVSWYADPLTGPDTRALPVSDAQAETLAAYIRAAFADGADALPVRLDRPGYGDDDAFFWARGHWTPVVTCNEFLARGLRAAGIRTGRWAPFTNGIVAHLS